MDTYLTMIHEEYARRRARNELYSIRAFARDLKMSSGSLSQILSAKRFPSVRCARHLIAALGMDDEQAERFLTSLAQRHGQRGLKRMRAAFRNRLVSSMQ